MPMAGQDKILWSISLEGADDVSKKLKAASDVGEDAARRLKQSFADVGKSGSGYGGFAQLAEGEAAAERFRDRLRETLHVLHPVLDEAGLGISNLGAFARLAGVGLGSLAAAIVGSVVVGLAKLGDETQKTKLHLNALGASGEAFDKLNEKAKKLGVSTSALTPGIEQYQDAVNKTDADLKRSVTHPPGYKGDETAPDVSILNGGRETGARVPLETYLGAHSALIESAQAEKISGDEASRQADAFEKKLLENRQLSSDAVRELSPTAANNLAHALEPVFGTSLKDGAALIAQLDRPGARLPSDNDVFKVLAKAEPDIAKQAEAAKGVVAGFEAVAAASKRLAEKLAPDGTEAGKQLSGVAKDIDTLASTTLQGQMKKALAEAFGAPGKTPNQQVQGFEPFGNPAQKAGEAATGTAPTSGRTVPKLNDDGSVNPYGGQPINRPDGYSNALGAAPQNEAQRRQQIIESAKISKEEYEFQKLFNQNIRDQNGGDHPTGDKDTYAPPTLGHYDLETGGFVARRKQLPRDPNAVPGAPQATTFPEYQRRLIKEFQDFYGPSGNPAGVKNPTIPEGLFVPGIIPYGDPYGKPGPTAPKDVEPSRGQNPGDAPLKRVYIGPEPDEERRRREEEERKRREEEGDGYAAGGHIHGPGSSTSDSIPAMLSDGEYVVKASAVSRIGVDRLDALNSGAAHFADGGSVNAPDGNYSVIYDPNTGGAYVNGNLFPPGSPILDIPFIKAAVERSKADMGDDDHKTKKSDEGFTGFFGGLAQNLEGPGYAAGGLVGRVLRHFADGGSVSAFSGGMISIPHLEFGGMPEMPDMGLGTGPVKTSGSGLDLPHHGTVDLRSDLGDHRVIAHEDVMRSLGAAAQRAKRFSVGRKPSWYGGGG